MTDAQNDNEPAMAPDLDAPYAVRTDEPAPDPDHGFGLLGDGPDDHRPGVIVLDDAVRGLAPYRDVEPDDG